MDEILTTKEASKFLKISEVFLRELIRKKKIHAYLEGRRGGYRILKEEINRYVRQRGMAEDSVHDSKGLKHAEEALRESEERFRALTESSSLAVGVSTYDGKFLYLNKAYERLLGYTKDELSQVNASELWVDPKDRQKMVEAVKGKGVLIDYEGQLKRKDGTPIWTSITINLINFTGVHAIMATVYNITDRKNAEKKLQESEEKYRELIETSNSIIMRVDKDLNIRFMNDFGLKFFGYTAEELLGKNAVGITIPRKDDQGRDLAAMAREITKHPEEYRTNVHQNMRKSGELVWVSWTNRVTYDKDGKIAGILAIGNDIENLKKAEDVLRRDKDTFEKLVRKRTEELITVQLELEKAKRLSDIGTLASTVAHELRNPLAAIHMASHNIKKKADDPGLIQHLATIDKKVDESDQIINNLLFYSRLTTPHYESVNLYDELLDSIKTAAIRILPETPIDFKADTVKGTVIEGDPVQLKEVFVNILINAGDAVRHLDSGAKIEISAKENKETVSICIKDNGVGMNEETLKRATEPFYTLKSKGTGLGLTVSKQIVEMHNGTLELKSQPEKGTRVFIHLPKERGGVLKNF